MLSIRSFNHHLLVSSSHILISTPHDLATSSPHPLLPASILQIPHPKRIRPSQPLWIDRSSNQIYRRLIRRQIPIRRLRQSRRLLHDQFAILRRLIPQLVRVRAALMLLREPKYHFVSDEDGQLLFEFRAGFGPGQTACYGHQGGCEEAFCR